MNEPLLSVQDLRVEFALDGQRVRAVDEVAFELAPGEVLGVVGESGCGKSVTSLAIMRLVPEPPGSLSGEVRFGGRDLLRLSEPEMREIRRGARPPGLPAPPPPPPPGPRPA